MGWGSKFQTQIQHRASAIDHIRLYVVATWSIRSLPYWYLQIKPFTVYPFWRFEIVEPLEDQRKCWNLWTFLKTNFHNVHTSNTFQHIIFWSHSFQCLRNLCFRFHFPIASNSSVYYVVRMFCVMFILGFVLVITFFYGRIIIARIIYIIGSFFLLVFFFAEVHFCHVVDKLPQTSAASSHRRKLNTNGRGHKTQKNEDFKNFS